MDTDQIIAELTRLIFEYDGLYVELRGDRVVNESPQDEIDDECALVYDGVADDLRKIRDRLLAEARS